MAYDILVVDDEADIRNIVSDLLNDEGYHARAAADGPSALEAISDRRPSLVVLDIWLGDTRFDGMKVLEVLNQDHPNVPVIMMSGHGTIETAVKAIKQGAYDFVEKPFKSDRLMHIIARAIETARLRDENTELRTKIDPDVVLIGESIYANQLRQTIGKVAPTNSRVFITGPSGSGKEVICRHIHALSPRNNGGPFVVVNCATMNDDNLEEELFGVEADTSKGKGQKTGLLEHAHLGTLVFDEVADMPLAIQGKITRLLQENRFKRMGGERSIDIDVRIIATSSRDIAFAIAEGRLREDLFYRLNVVPINVKPLRDRKEDIIELAKHFLDLACQTSGQPQRELSDEALTALQMYAWPGNIRQLRNVMDWILIMANNAVGESITAEMLPPEIMSDLPVVTEWKDTQEVLQLPLREAREKFEKQYLLSQVSRFSGNISQTAHFIGMERSALHRKLRTLGVDRSNSL